MRHNFSYIEPSLSFFILLNIFFPSVENFHLDIIGETYYTFFITIAAVHHVHNLQQLIYTAAYKRKGRFHPYLLTMPFLVSFYNKNFTIK